MQSAHSTDPLFRPPLAAGLRIGGCFSLVREVGEVGGFPVWLARDETFTRRVALHFLPEPEKLDARTVIEIRALVRRQAVHPGVIRVHDFVEDAGRLAIVTGEWEGEALADLLKKKGAFDPAEIKSWLRQIAELMHAAAGTGGTQDDLSAAHFFIRPNGAVFMCHFGIGRILEENFQRKKRSKKGKPRQRGPKRDEAAILGALAFQLLCGKRTNELQSKSASWADELDQARAAIQRGPIPSEWRRFIDACLSTSSANRPKSRVEALALLDAKGGLVEPPREPVTANQPAAAKSQVRAVRTPLREDRPVGSLARSSARFPWRPVLGITITVLVGVLVIGGGIWGFRRWWNRGPRAAEPIAAAPLSLPQAEPAPKIVEKSEAAPAMPALKRVEPEPAPKPLPELLPIPQVPGSLVPLKVPKNASAQTLAELMAERRELFEAHSKAAEAAEKVERANERIRGIRQQLLEERRKREALKRENQDSMKEVTASLLLEKAQLEEKVRVAESAAKASEASTLPDSAEKLRAAETAKRELFDWLAKHNESLLAAAESAGEVSRLSQAVEEAVRATEEAGQSVEQAGILREEMQAAADAVGKEIAQLSAALEKANRSKINALERQIQSGERKLIGGQCALIVWTGLRAFGPMQGGSKSWFEQKERVERLKEDVLRLKGLEVPASPPPAIPEKPEPAPTAPPPSPAIEKQAEPAVDRSKNSLGMTMVPVGKVQMAAQLVTRRNYEVFAKASKNEGSAWKDLDFEQTPDDPVVKVTWGQAVAFCQWLTLVERKAGLLDEKTCYRLPSDLEWSEAVGLKNESGDTPEARDMRVENVYPWGTSWPPPAGAGNYAGREAVAERVIAAYEDGFPHTSPAGSFKPNALGIYDLGGNVWQWVEDSYDGRSRAMTLRGGSWCNGGLPMELLSSSRRKASAETVSDTFGFRVVKAGESR